MTQIPSVCILRENDVLIFKSPHYSHFLLSIKHDKVDWVHQLLLRTLPNKSWTSSKKMTKEKTNLKLKRFF